MFVDALLHGEKLFMKRLEDHKDNPELVTEKRREKRSLKERTGVGNDVFLSATQPKPSIDRGINKILGIASSGVAIMQPRFCHSVTATSSSPNEEGEEDLDVYGAQYRQHQVQFNES